ncbi:MAG: Bax inhibitor-1/YccA family protein, partial [Muribaculaceae bacterium]|nr:Bax inhibitor-1/YccA family protein [Muribaculaceae bacterium]
YLSFMVNNHWFMWVLIIAEFGLVFGISGAINKLSSAVASTLFYLFAVINGLMLCTIFLVYSPAAITKTFFITAGTFGAMSVYGYFTTKDLSRFGSFLFMALIGLIIASLVNIFLHSSTLDWIVSIAGVIIFVGLTAWDTQQVKIMAQNAPADAVSRLATVGALSLYLDFINLFLYLLRIFGGNRD